MNYRNIKKAGIVLTLSVFCMTGSLPGQQQNMLKTVQAATTSISKAVPSCKLVSRTAGTVKLSVKTVKGASSYRVYRSTSKNGSYAYIGSTSGSSYQDTGLKSSKTYYYKVQAVNGSSKSKMSPVVTAAAAPAKVTGVSVTAKSNSLKLSWSKINGMKEYRIYRATDKNGAFKKIGTTASASYTDKTVKSGKTYYYKVRACKTASGANYYGAYSNVVSGKVKQTQSVQNNQQEEVLRLVNIERKKEGLSPLTTTAVLQKAADKRAVETKTLFSHDRPDGSSCFTVLEEFGISYQAAGENIAYGQRTPAEVVEGWMNSPGHRANIMSQNFGKVGIGYYQSNGVIYWTQLFTN